MYSPKKILHGIYEIAETLKANTERSRVMTLARIGSYFIQIAIFSIDVALIP